MLNSPVGRRGPVIGLLTFLFAVTLQSQAPPLPLPSTPLIFAGSGPGGGLLRVLQADGTPLVTVAPFGGSFTGGVRVAAGDVNGDGITDVVVAMASGGGQVRMFSGADGSPLGDSSPFGTGFTGGVFVATGDVNADGHDDILLGAGTGSGLAKLIDGATLGEVGPGAPFGSGYTGGVTVAMGDVNGDGRADLIFGTAFGGLIRIFDGPTLAPLVSAFPYGPLFPGGVNVAAGDVNGDGIDEVAFAPRSSGGPVRVYTMQAELLIEGHPFNGVQGVNLAMHDVNGDGRDDLVMGAGAGATPRLRTFSILDRTLHARRRRLRSRVHRRGLRRHAELGQDAVHQPGLDHVHRGGGRDVQRHHQQRRQRGAERGRDAARRGHVHRPRQRHGDAGRHAGGGHRRQLRPDLRGHARRRARWRASRSRCWSRSRRRSAAPTPRCSPSAAPTPSR